MKYLLILLILPLIGYSQRIKEVQKVNTHQVKKENLKGNIHDEEWFSDILKENRSITVYHPPNFNYETTYSVLFVTDGITKSIAGYIESLISKKLIEPIIIVGVNLRKPQKSDSILGKHNIDFRSKEMLKGNFTLKEEYKFKENPYFNKIIHNRHERFMKYIAYEVIPFIKSNYKLENNSEKWTIGGFSNGGAFVYSFACSYPGLFGNSIVMSPAGYNDYDILKSKCKYFICVGKYEHYSFMDNSLEYLTLMEENQIDYIHKTYDASHDWEMWLGFYIESIRIIY